MYQDRLRVIMLNVAILKVAILKVAKLNVVMLCITRPSVAMLNVIIINFALLRENGRLRNIVELMSNDWHCAECRHADCHGTKRKWLNKN
jgi:hypothetical protein